MTRNSLVKKFAGRQSDLSFNLPHNSSMYLAQWGVVALSFRVRSVDEIETKSSISKSMASSRIDPSRSFIWPSITRARLCVCASDTRAYMCLHPIHTDTHTHTAFTYTAPVTHGTIARSHDSTDVRVREHGRARVYVAATEKPIGLRNAAKSRR